MNVKSNIRKRNKQTISDRYKKVDTTVNGDAERLVEEHRKVEKRLYPLRIDHRTAIYVTKDKLTPEYLEMKRKQFNPVVIKERKGGNPRATLNVEEVRTLVRSGMYLKDIAMRLGVSKTTIDNYIRKYNLRNEDGK